MTNTNNDLFIVMEQAKTAVSALTGIKQQFIDAGWSDSNAEQAVVAMLMANSSRKP